VWVDESGFYLLPARVRTYAPRGQTPILHVPLTRDHLSASSAVTARGQVLIRVQRGAYRSHGVVRFLQHLLQQIGGKLLVMWDGSPIQRSRVITACLASGAAKRLQVERVPGDAPERNPVEAVWH